MKSIVEPHVRLLGTVMDMQLQRQNVITGNIANVNTPKSKPRELEFEAELQSALNLDAKGVNIVHPVGFLGTLKEARPGILPPG